MPVTLMPAGSEGSNLLSDLLIVFDRCKTFLRAAPGAVKRGVRQPSPRKRSRIQDTQRAISTYLPLIAAHPEDISALITETDFL